MAHHRCAVLGLPVGAVASTVRPRNRTRIATGGSGASSPRPTRTAMSASIVADEMQALCDELFAAHQRLDPDTIERFYADQPDGIYFWERALVYDHAEIVKTIGAISSSVAALSLTPGEFRGGVSG